MSILEVRGSLPPQIASNRYAAQVDATCTAIDQARADHPGMWCLVHEYKSGSGATAAAKSFHRRYPNEPVEFAGRTIDGVSGLWCRWPETEGDAADAV